MSLVYSASQKVDAGVHAYIDFHNEAVKKYPQNYGITLKEAKTTLTNLEPRFFELLGNAVIVNKENYGWTEQDVSDKMIQLADANEGKMPAKLSDFLRPFSNPDVLTWSPMKDVNLFVHAVVEGTKETAGIVADAATTTLKVGSWAIPIALALVGGLLLFQKAGGRLRSA